MFRFVIAALAAVFVFLGSESQAQQTQCGPSATLAQHLADNFGERPVFEGVTPDGSLLVFFVNDTSGTWTIALVQGSAACLVAAGQKASMKPMGVSL